MDTSIKITTWPILTGLLAFAGAVFGQLFHHFFAAKRDKKKYKMEAYQKLYAPILLNILLYIKIKTIHISHDANQNEDPEKMISEVIEHIGKNLGYAEPIVITLYNNILTRKYFDDISEFYHDVEKLELLAYFLIDTINLFGSYELFVEKIKNEIGYVIVKYLIWIIFSIAVGDVNLGAELASLSYYLDNIKYRKSLVIKLIKIKNMKFEDHNEYIKGTSINYPFFTSDLRIRLKSA